MAAKYEIFIVANADQAEAVMGRLGATMGATGAAADVQAPKVLNLAERLKGMGPAGTVANTAISDLSAGLAGRLGVASEAAQEGIGKATTGMLGMGAAAGPAALAVGAVAAETIVAAEVVKKSSEAYLGWVEQVKQLSEVSGTSMQDASVLAESFKLLGVDSDIAGRALGRLGQNIGSGAFKKYADDVRYAADGSVDLNQTLLVLAEKFRTNTDAASRNAEMAKAFGKSWQDIVPVLATLTPQLEAIAATKAPSILTEEDKQKAIDYQNAVQTLTDALNKLWVAIGSSVVPQLAHLADALAHGITNVESFAQSNSGLMTVLRRVVDVINPLVGLYDLWSHFFPSTVGGNQALNTALEQQAQWAAQAAAQVQNLAAAQLAERNAATTFAQDSIAAQRSDISLAQVQASWQAKLTSGASGRASAEASAAKQVADIRRSLVDTELADSRAIIDAKHAVGKAQEDLTVVEQKAAQSIVQAKDAILAAQQRLRKDSETDVRSARNLADAKLKLARTEQDIADGKLQGLDATRAYEDATTNLQRTQEDAAAAAQSQAQQVADDRKAVSQAEQALATQRLQNARDVRDAEYRVAMAVRSEADAEVKRSKDIADATRRIADAMASASQAMAAAGPTALDYKQHQLDVEAATLQSALAHEKLNGDLREMVGHIQDGSWTYDQFKARLDALHLTQFPNLVKDYETAGKKAEEFYKKVQAGKAQAGMTGPTSSFAPGNSTYNSQVPQFNVHISGNPVISDKHTADAFGKAVAEGVWHQFIQWQNNGTNLGFNSPKRGGAF